MVKSMTAAVAGLRSHQTKMDVLGNNIANVNTWGYKSSVTNFQDALYSNQIVGAEGNTNPNGTGGVNTSQMGYGALVSSISKNFAVGSGQYTGNSLDCMVDGSGFFIVGTFHDSVGLGLRGEGVSLSRVGIFRPDNNGYLVDDNGNYVYGFATEMDPKTGEVTADESTLIPIRIPNKIVENESGFEQYTDARGNTVYYDSTSEKFFSPVENPGNLTPLYNQLEKDGCLVFSTPDNVQVKLNEDNGVYYDMDDNPYVAQNTLIDTGGPFESTCLEITGYTDAAGRALPLQKNTVDGKYYKTYDNKTNKFTEVYREVELIEETVQDVAGFTKYKTEGGQTYYRKGDEFYSKADDSDPKYQLRLLVTKCTDKDGNVKTAVPTDPTTPPTTIGELFKYKDENGDDQTACFVAADNAYYKYDDTSKTINTTDTGKLIILDTENLMPVDDKTSLKIDPATKFTMFQDDTGATVYFDNENTQQYYTEPELTANSTLEPVRGDDRYTITTWSIGTDGSITGVDVDNKVVSIGMIAVASVENPNGLEQDSGYLYSIGDNAGAVQAIKTTAATGKIKSNQLEMSNVDLAQDISTMITTQRGYQANTKIITVTDEMLEQLVSMKR